MKLDFSGRHVVVTGGSGALGGAVVGQLVEAGATCHVPCRDETELGAFPLADDPSVNVATGVDLADEADAQRFFAALPTLWASIHAAGGFTMGPIAQTALADLDRMLRINLTTCFLSCREAVKTMRAKGKGGGRIVNVAAQPALVPTGGMAAYAASKAAVANLTQGLAQELRGEDIWVNAVVPSIMDTPANRRAMPDADFDAWPRTDEVARTMVFLASPQNAVTRGALVPVYGRS